MTCQSAEVWANRVRQVFDGKAEVFPKVAHHLFEGADFVEEL